MAESTNDDVSALPPAALVEARATKSAWLRLLGKHQLSANFATVVDFGVMVLAVEMLHVSPVVGTVLGATCGAVANFSLGRYWTFQATAGDAPGQALRYAF